MKAKQKLIFCSLVVFGFYLPSTKMFADEEAGCNETSNQCLESEVHKYGLVGLSSVDVLADAATIMSRILLTDPIEYFLLKVKNVVGKKFDGYGHVHMRSSQSFCNFLCDGTKEFEALEKLNYTNKYVEFDSKRFNPYYVTGGTCTAMSLYLLAYVESHCRIAENLSFEKTVSCFEEAVSKLETSSGKFRGLQAAFNSIALKQENDDPLRSKIEAMAKYFNLTITHVFPQEVVHDWPRSDDFKHSVRSLPVGAYLLRMISPSSNHKKESYGHSTVFIKAEKGSFFFDPNFGLTSLDTPDDIIYETYKQWEMYEIDYPRLYRLECSGDGCTNL